MEYIYTSFQCSGCATLHEELREIIQKYIDSGDIKYIEKINKEKMESELKEVPTIFINGEKIEVNISKEEFENKIESLLNRK